MFTFQAQITRLRSGKLERSGRGYKLSYPVPCERPGWRVFVVVIIPRAVSCHTVRREVNRLILNANTAGTGCTLLRIVPFSPSSGEGIYFRTTSRGEIRFRRTNGCPNTDGTGCKPSPPPLTGVANNRRTCSLRATGVLPLFMARYRTPDGPNNTTYCIRTRLYRVRMGYRRYRVSGVVRALPRVGPRSQIAYGHENVY